MLTSLLIQTCHRDNRENVESVICAHHSTSICIALFCVLHVLPNQLIFVKVVLLSKHQHSLWMHDKWKSVSGIQKSVIVWWRKQRSNLKQLAFPIIIGTYHVSKRFEVTHQLMPKCGSIWSIFKLWASAVSYITQRWARYPTPFISFSAAAKCSKRICIPPQGKIKVRSIKSVCVIYKAT